MPEENENLDSEKEDIFGEEKPEEEKKEGESKPEVEEKSEDDSKAKAEEELEAKNRQLFERTKKAEEKAAQALKEVQRLKKSGAKSSLEVDEYIDISASLEGLDAREKKYLAEQSKLTGKPLSEIRGDENFQLWQNSYREKVEKEKAADPSTRQVESKKPKTFEEEIEASKSSNPFEITPEREETLAKAGLWKPPGVRAREKRIPLS